MSEESNVEEVEEEEVEETEEVDEEEVEEEKEVKYTDEDVDEILNRKFAKWQAQKEEEINEAKKLADMNAQEKAEHERDKLKRELEELRNAQTKNEMTKTARNMLRERNIDVTDDLLNLLVSVEADETKSNVESFTKLFDEAVEKRVLEKIKNPKHNRGGTSTITKDEILAIKDTKTRQEKIKENLHLFD